MREVPSEMAANLHAAAEDLLASFDDIQMHDIAVAAGMARSSLYHYFTSKDDVLSCLVRSMLQELTAATCKAAVGPGRPADLLDAVIRAQLILMNDHPGASQRLAVDLGRASQLRDIAAQIHHGFEVPVRQLLAAGTEGQTLLGLDGDDLCPAAVFGATLAIGLRALVVDGHIDVERVMSTISPIFRYGIAPPEPA